MSNIRHPNRHTDAKGWRIRDNATFMYEEGETSQETQDTVTKTNQTTTTLYITSDIKFFNGDRLMLPNKSERPYMVVSIPASKPKYNKRRGKFGTRGSQIREWTLYVIGD